MVSLQRTRYTWMLYACFLKDAVVSASLTYMIEEKPEDCAFDNCAQHTLGQHEASLEQAGAMSYFCASIDKFTTYISHPICQTRYPDVNSSSTASGSLETRPAKDCA